MSKSHRYDESIQKSGYTVINCNDCGYWHVNPMPAEEELNEYYEKKYFLMFGEDRSMTDKKKDPDGFYAIQYDDVLRNLGKCMPAEMPKTILDIGAGYGDFLRFMKNNGWQTFGLEPNESANELLKEREELNIRQCSPDSLINEGFDKTSVVSLNSVLEHLREPEELLVQIKENLLSKKGILSVFVPNDFSEIQDLLMKTVLKDVPEKQYYWVTPPEHVNYWSIETMKRFLEKCGYEILDYTVDYPMEFFPLMGEDYVNKPEIGRGAHLKRVQLEKNMHETGFHDLKDKLFKAFSRIGVGRSMQIFAVPREKDE